MLSIERLGRAFGLVPRRAWLASDGFIAATAVDFADAVLAVLAEVAVGRLGGTAFGANNIIPAA
jgi:hypothetical protein